MMNNIKLINNGLRKLSTLSVRSIRPDFKLVCSSLAFLNVLEREKLKNNGFIFSKLSNGLRVISKESESKISKLGLFIRMGTRMESKNSLGASRLLYDLTINSKSKNGFGPSLIDKFNLNGAVLHGTQSKELTSLFLEYLNGVEENNIEEFLDSIFRVHQFDFKDSEIENSKREVSKYFETRTNNIEELIHELLHSTAWSKGALGNLQTHTTEQIMKIKRRNLEEYKNQYFSPENMIIFGIGVKHIDLLKKAMKYSEKSSIFGNKYEDIINKDNITPSIYTGGMKTLYLKEPFTNITVALNTGFDWKSLDFVALSILQAHLGGGSSFSVGGPGKGMYSKLFLDVLNKFDWVESCNCFINQFSDSGIFGIQVVSFPGFSFESLKTIALQFKNMRELTNEELSRAKNIVKGAVSMIYEDKNLLMEDIAMQILSHSEYITTEDLVSSIDKIESDDIKRVSEKILSGIDRPTVIAVGSDINQLPEYHEIKNLLKQAVT
ncbi:mitochondrial processing peptidase [Cryptosporidium ryanae]|uniref:mitochondrial processing peptidase n=1 Tax=Cryptosporidium ryanae TaxID=515981 RepID=UPI00351A5874|nr:mitochondrial processing peptidase [Cryptosporidium ryanae]